MWDAGHSHASGFAQATADTGTGSKPHFDQGLQESTRRNAYHQPRIAPCFSRDSSAYELQLGKCLQYGGRSSALAQNE